MWLRVVLPYTFGSLPPNRLRLGPWSTRISSIHTYLKPTAACHTKARSKKSTGITGSTSTRGSKIRYASGRVARVNTISIVSYHNNLINLWHYPTIYLPIFRFSWRSSSSVSHWRNLASSSSNCSPVCRLLK